MNQRYISEEKAVQYAREIGNCAQCTVAGIMDADEVSPITSEILKATTGFAGGIGKSGYACGALTGGVISLSAYAGRGKEAFYAAEDNSLAIEMANELQKRFMNEFKGGSCLDVQEHTMGISYLLSDPDQKAAYGESDGPKKYCPETCGLVARWVFEILNDHGLK